MKRIIIVSILSSITMFFTGCASTGGGLFGKLQTADELLATKYGIPVPAVREVRKVLGIPDARALPGPERVLPEGLELTYDMLDGNNQVVDVSLYHRAPTPRIVKAGSVQQSVFDVSPSKSSALDLESVLKMIKAHSSQISAKLP